MSIEVSNLQKFYGEQAALGGISFKVKTGEIVGFLGPNGAGKSTTMKIITGFIPASDGKVKVCGLDVEENSMAVRRKIGYLPEHNPLYLDMYVKEYLDFVADVYKISNKRERIAEMIQLVGLEREQHKKIGALSKGYRQRVGLAQAMIHDPEVLILDEPTSGLDPNQLVDIRKLIKKIGKTKTVMLSTHIMQEVEAICDRVVIINNGQIVADNSAKELQHQQNEQVIIVEFDEEVSVSRNELKKIPGVQQVRKVEESTSWLLQSNKEGDLRKIVSRHAAQNDWLIISLKVEEKSLEQVFKELTGKK
ncbi:gliding motility-associated ABC transporter ATP-binding subunit GldA [Wandonia haliotis]|uniref:Gliding motility-associated ABC transporter ATP-binding subunit GldA n=1 Tax=Wandonia haliotis TaxID=574963 RepID=A0ABP3Y0D9_9FLAO